MTIGHYYDNEESVKEKINYIKKNGILFVTCLGFLSKNF